MKSSVKLLGITGAVASLFISLSASAASRKVSAVDQSQYEMTSVAEDRPNALSVELLGRGGLYSVDYDRTITRWLGLGVGFSYLPLSSSDPTNYSNSMSASIMIIPVYANIYFNPGPHRAFLSGGVDTVVVSGTVTYSGSSYSGSGLAVLPVFGVGYEYRGEGGFLFREAPYVVASASGIAITGGITLGGSF